MNGGERLGIETWRPQCGCCPTQQASPTRGPAPVAVTVTSVGLTRDVQIVHQRVHLAREIVGRLLEVLRTDWGVGMADYRLSRIG